MTTAAFKIDLNKEFPHLGNAPIVEAIIQWQARATKPLDTSEVKAALLEKLDGFSSCEPIQLFRLAATMQGASGSSVVEQARDWHGYRLKSADERCVVQVTRDGVTFSRLRPYEDWARFSTAAKRAWQVFMEIGAPVDVQRLGVRFINHLATATPQTLGAYLKVPPTCPLNLPLNEFLYQSTFIVPGEPFDIRVIKIMQPTVPDQPQGAGIFVDVDVYTTRSTPCEDLDVDNTLTKMRWLKNAIFFSLLTDEAINSYK